MVGLALFLTKADGTREYKRGRGRKRERCGEQQRRRWFLCLATQKATTKLVHFLINNTRLRNSFENQENLKLCPCGRHEAEETVHLGDSDGFRMNKLLSKWVKHPNERASIERQRLDSRAGWKDSLFVCLLTHVLTMDSTDSPNVFVSSVPPIIPSIKAKHFHPHLLNSVKSSSADSRWFGPQSLKYSKAYNTGVID